jgi:hypothetical protein
MAVASGASGDGDKARAWRMACLVSTPLQRTEYREIPWLAERTIVVVRAPKISSALRRTVELRRRGAVVSRRRNFATGPIPAFRRYPRLVRASLAQMLLPTVEEKCGV